MTDKPLRFTDDFPVPSREEWVAEVERVLKGAPFDKKMSTRTYEGVTLRPIYTQEDWAPQGDPSGFPGTMPLTRAGHASGNRTGNWDVRQRFTFPDAAKCNDIILNDLTRGVTSVHIVLDAASRAGLDPDHAAAEALVGVEGISVATLDDLDRLLTGVLPELLTISLDAGPQFVAAAGLLDALWRRRGVGPEAARGAFNADPLGVLAGTGSLPVTPEVALEQMADLAVYTSKAWPLATSVAVDTSPYHEAGANESQDLAISMSTALTYLKAMADAGLSIDDAARQILFTYPVTCDQFLGIAKLRAARKLWARVTEACGVSEDARAMRLDAVSARRMFTKRDPWVNMLRTTVSCFASAIGGADSITVWPFDAAIGHSDELGRRIARNTQVILAEESNLAKVIDPGGGSWYVEARTDELAEAAWAEFQAIEAAGGILTGIKDGSIAEKIAASWAEREKALAKRKDPITGVSEFPNVLEESVEGELPDLPAIRSAAAARVAAGRKGAELVSAVEDAESAAAAAAAGATIGQIAGALAGEATEITPLPSHRLAERFEELRDAADTYKDKTGARPTIFLANLAAVAKHTARATFAKNFFEVAGIEAIGNTGFMDAESCADGFKESGSRIAILCSADPVYEEMAEGVARALKAAGCDYIFLAGAPGEKKEAYQAAGIDDFIFMGADVLSMTRATLTRLGVL
ncbi:methylmalonyl-CoA mutase family protein [Tropicimonas marinistellae]|uniref:methylmalonyl-CoA mutase family protein n=1 Tax=Tropicimonas marinistellae TaxID=1739787 RepID=UPI0008352D0E|nr:methylmalonyl-CoA mutase family protein [Tropicimonas marinistellae]